MSEAEKVAVLDTETTWKNELMSVGAVVADSVSFEPVSQRYYILLPYKEHGGMYSGALYARGLTADLECGREKAVSELKGFLDGQDVRRLFAYNARFDYGLLPELAGFEWYDIITLAAYRQYNKKIPASAECFGTGRLKSGFGVEGIYRMLSGDTSYIETHNALYDALDELMIMKMLGQPAEKYGRINPYQGEKYAVQK